LVEGGGGDNGHRPVTPPYVNLGVVVAPGLAREVTEGIAEDLLADLRERYATVDWGTTLTVDPLVAPPVPTTELLDAARRKLLEADWDLGIIVTDLPLRLGGRPVSRHASPTHAIGVVSLPALGPLHLRRRLRRALVELVAELVGDGEGDTTEWRRNVLRELGTDVPAETGAARLTFVPAVLFSHLRLLLGMVRANQPWRLVARLYGALAAAFAVGLYGVVTSDIWRLSATMGWLRLALACVASITITVVAVIAAHELWERAPDPRVREQVILFNIATAATVVIGIFTLYVTLFVLIFASAELVISRSVLADAIEHSAGLGDYAVLAWFVASLSTVAGALGAGLESDEAVREAAYAARRR
jgi:hypothetical protein